MYNIYKPIKTLEEVKGLSLYLYYEKHVAFHPEDPFEDYINTDDNNQCFTTEESIALNSRMEECFDVCQKEDVDIYNFMMQFSPIHSLMD